MKFYYTITPDPAELARELKGDILKSRRAGMINVVTTIEAIAKKGAPVKTSSLANSGTSDVNPEGTKGTITFIARYAEWAHEGTGLYGPHKEKIVSKIPIVIRPKKAKVLFFFGSPFSGSGEVFAKSVRTTKPFFWPGAKHPVHSTKGMKGKPFLRDAAEGADISALYKEGMENFLGKR